MFQPRVKLEFVRRYCPPDKGWKVFVDIDASEEGRTGGFRNSLEARERQTQMKEDASKVREEFRQLGVAVGGNRANWYSANNLPELEGDRDIVAFNSEKGLCIIAEAEGASSRQPEQKLYKAIGQIVMAVSNCNLENWEQRFFLIVHGEQISKHLKKASALEILGVAAISLNKEPTRDHWLFGEPLQKEEYIL
ncbi:hypothetical protein [Methanolobus sp.]|uniref:hypothetical protein n=1 Tax=Methanolobus sp. TaxID=1874737 RepID=UPI0025D5933A|nr:hypothetical protein [Methanolobus sp.]